MALLPVAVTTEFPRHRSPSFVRRFSFNLFHQSSKISKSNKSKNDKFDETGGQRLTTNQ